MNNSDKLCFKWDEFSENMRSTLKEERHISDLTDVTLVCEDETQIEAHKLILARGSTLFSNLLRLKKGPSCIFYMKGIKGKQLEAVVDFLYNGEVNIYEDDIDNFLTNAEEFQLKGLIGLKESEFGKQKTLRENDIKIKIPTKSQEHPNEINTSTIIKPEPFEDEPVLFAPVKQVKVAGIEDMNKHTNEMIDKTGIKWKCKVCGKEASGSGSNLKRHTQIHMEGNLPTYLCNICGKEYRSKEKLRCHEFKLHSFI